VWSLRKFGAYLVLRSILPENPAKPLRHPKMSPRSQLPRYLSETQLKTLLHSAAQKLNKREFAIVGLICSTGMRPFFSVAALKREQLKKAGQDAGLAVDLNSNMLRHTLAWGPGVKP
jgi:site-specific recombinase XerD